MGNSDHGTTLSVYAPSHPHYPQGVGTRIGEDSSVEQNAFFAMRWA